jgi:hypothetical protein
MTKEDLKQIEELIKRHKPDCGGGNLIVVLFLLFLTGCFKGCGY